MKKMNIILSFFCIFLLLSGCSNFKIAPTIEDLISPIKPSGDNAGVQAALDSFCSDGYSLKIPSKGENATSYIFRDLNGDKIDEAIAFYIPSNEIGSVCMAIIQKDNDVWKVVSNIDGGATEVYSIDFADLDNDKSQEIIVCWSVVSKSTGYKIDVYGQFEEDDSYSLRPICDSILGNDFISADMNNDGYKDILVFMNNQSADGAKAELYSFKNKKALSIGSTRIDGSITSISNLTSSDVEDDISVFADCYKTDGFAMVTEYIYWSDYYDSIISPFYSYSTGRTVETSRNNLVTCRDIDGDELIEIPLDASVEKLPSEISAQDWQVYGNTVLTHKCYSLASARDNYILVIPSNLFNDMEVNYDSEKRILYIAKSDDEKGIEIQTVIQSAYEENKDSYLDYQEIFSDSGFVYLARIDKSSNCDITLNDLKMMIKAYK